MLEQEEAKDVRDSSETGAGATHYRVDEDGRIVFNKEGTPILRQLTDEVQQQQWANAGVRWVLLKDGEQPRPLSALDVNVLFDDKVRVYSHTISTGSEKAIGNKRKPELEVEELDKAYGGGTKKRVVAEGGGIAFNRKPVALSQKDIGKSSSPDPKGTLRGKQGRVTSPAKDAAEEEGRQAGGYYELKD